MNWIDRTLGASTHLLTFSGGVLVMAMMLHIVADVLSKWLFNFPLDGTLEIVSHYYMVGLIFLPLAFVQQKGSHIVAEIFTYFPFTAPSMLMVRLGVGSEMSDGEVVGSLVIVATTALAMLWVAARIFRAGILLSGQRITGRTVAEALRHAD